jgi:cyclic-di-AMP phosphodiesterase PgpH
MSNPASFSNPAYSSPAAFSVGFMSVLRQITYQMANRACRLAYRLWSRLQTRLKKSFLWPEGFVRVMAKSDPVLSRARLPRLPVMRAKRTWLLTLLAIVLLSACFGQRFYNEPGLDVDSISPQTFYAPESVVFEDTQETERKRNEARNVAVSVLKIDAEQTALATRSLDTLLQQGRELRSQAGSPPFLNLEILSKPTQEALFQILDLQWTTLWDLAATNTLSSAQLEPFLTSADSASASASAQPRPGQPVDLSTSVTALAPQLVAHLRAFSPGQVAALRELVAYRELAGNERLARLKVRMDTPRQQYRKAVDELAQAASTEEQPLYNYRLFDLSEAQWLLLEDNAHQIFSEIMAQGVHPGSPPDLLRRAIDVRVAADLSTLSTPDLRQLTKPAPSNRLSRPSIKLCR